MIQVRRLDNSYMSLLTPYSFSFVKDQLEQVGNVQIMQQLDDGKSCLVLSHGQSVTCSIDSCPCGFVSSMKLPCRHILAVRTAYSLPVFDESLCAQRWKLQHFFSHHQAYLPADSSGNSADCDDALDISTCIFEPKSTVLSEQQKYKKAFKVAQNLCQQLSTFGMHDFIEGMQVLQSVASLWNGGKRIHIQEATGI